MTLKKITLPQTSRAKNAELRTLKRLQKYLATREPNVPFELGKRELELTRKALSHYLAEKLVDTIETR